MTFNEKESSLLRLTRLWASRGRDENSQVVIIHIPDFVCVTRRRMPWREALAFGVGRRGRVIPCEEEGERWRLDDDPHSW